MAVLKPVKQCISHQSSLLINERKQPYNNWNLNVNQKTYN